MKVTPFSITISLPVLIASPQLFHNLTLTSPDMSIAAMKSQTGNGIAMPRPEGRNSESTEQAVIHPAENTGRRDTVLQRRHPLGRHSLDTDKLGGKVEYDNGQDDAIEKGKPEDVETICTASESERLTSEATRQHLDTLDHLEANHPREEEGRTVQVPGDRKGIWDNEEPEPPRTPQKVYENWVDRADDLESEIGAPSGTRYYRVDRN
ncbi:hypothetical protein BJ170DRAFT_715543 [Xylariales sp. AK1849]|nr:hypothetical protein BJ170DRAFT_715543 [Xylariales sp. AK1849]